MPVVLNLGREHTATVLPERGGLLSQLRLFGTELLWTAPEFSLAESGWPGGGMPLCFPFAGRVFHEGRALHYQVGEQLFHMPLHGFAYALPWQIVDQDAASVELQLESGSRTAELFPYRFRLRARYTLTPQGLEVTVTTQHLQGPSAPATAPRMPVAMGFHPYFALASGSGATVPRLQTTATAKIRVTPVGGAGKTAQYPESPEEATGLLSDPLLQNVILGAMTEPHAELHYGDSGPKLRLEWSDVIRYLVLWTQPGKGFHCIEPWMGLPDALHNGEGLHQLAPGDELSLRLTLKLTP